MHFNSLTNTMHNYINFIILKNAHTKIQKLISFIFISLIVKKSLVLISEVWLLTILKSWEWKKKFCHRTEHKTKTVVIAQSDLHSVSHYLPMYLTYLES